MKCAIIAGGMGTRLRSIVGEIPKPMVTLDGIPLLERLVRLCRRFGFTDLHFFLAHVLVETGLKGSDNLAGLSDAVRWAIGTES